MFGYSLISDHHEQKKIICLRPSDLLLQCTDIFNSYVILTFNIFSYLNVSTVSGLYDL
jgi:hypothetical protein